MLLNTKGLDTPTSPAIRLLGCQELFTGIGGSSPRVTSEPFRPTTGSDRAQEAPYAPGRGDPGLRLALAGIAIGTLAALAANRLLRGFLFGGTTTDPMTYVAIAALLLLVGLLACFAPARRATRIDPVSALRCE